MRSPLDLYPRAKYCAYEDDGPGLLCAGCATDEYGIRVVWQALHSIQNDVGLTQVPLGWLLRKSPLEPCRECLTVLWETLPKPVTD